ncbi:MAG: hypothetical protein ACI9W2_002638 [Gammaproteobacteria bacterium]|jgi:hypothetical protein
MRAFLKHRVRRYLGLDSEELSGFGISSFLASNAPKYSLSQTVSVWDEVDTSGVGTMSSVPNSSSATPRDSMRLP